MTHPRPDNSPTAGLPAERVVPRSVVACSLPRAVARLSVGRFVSRSVVCFASRHPFLHVAGAARVGFASLAALASSLRVFPGLSLLRLLLRSLVRCVASSLACRLLFPMHPCAGTPAGPHRVARSLPSRRSRPSPRPRRSTSCGCPSRRFRRRRRFACSQGHRSFASCWFAHLRFVARLFGASRPR